MLLLMVLVLLACRSKTKRKTGVRYEQAGDGSVTVKGAPPLRGDSKTCAAYQACCRLPDLGLACTLTQMATKGDCAAALQSVRKQIAERGLTAPEGCK